MGFNLEGKREKTVIDGMHLFCGLFKQSSPTPPMTFSQTYAVNLDLDAKTLNDACCQVCQLFVPLECNTTINIARTSALKERSRDPIPWSALTRGAVPMKQPFLVERPAWSTNVPSTCTILGRVLDRCGSIKHKHNVNNRPAPVGGCRCAC